MPPNHFESEVESFLEGSHGDRTHIKRADHHTVTPLCGTLLLCLHGRPLFLESRIHFSGASMRVDSDTGDQPPDWVATRPGSPCLVVLHALPSDTASFLDNHTARSRHDAAIWKAQLSIVGP